MDPISLYFVFLNLFYIHSVRFSNPNIGAISKIISNQKTGQNPGKG